MKAALPRDFRLYLLISVMGALVHFGQGVAVGWSVYEQTGSSLALGLVGLAQFLPILLFFLPAGQVADRFERRSVIVTSLALGACAALLLAGAAWLHLDVAWTYAALVLSGCAQILNRPARDALMPTLVPPAQLARAIALASSLHQVASMAAPALAGLGLALFHSALPIHAANAVFTLIALLATLAIRQRSRGTKTQPGGAGRLREMLAGFTHIRRTRLLLAVMSIDLLAVLFGGAVALLPMYAKDILQVGPAGLGLLSTAPAVGAAVAGLAIARFGVALDGRLFLAAVGGFGLMTLVFGASTHFPLSVAALTLLGGLDSISVVIRQTVIQQATPDALRGRVAAVNRVFISSSNELGALESGLLAALIGPVPAVVGGGLITLLVVAASPRLFPELGRWRRAAPPEPPRTSSDLAQVRISGPAHTRDVVPAGEVRAHASAHPCSALDGILQHHGHRPTELLQILINAQQLEGWLPAPTLTYLAQALRLPRARVEGVAGFYSFLYTRPAGRFRVLFSDNITDRMLGNAELMDALCRKLWIEPGKLSEDGLVSIDATSCTGLCDQGPAMLVNGRAIGQLNHRRINEIAELIRQQRPLAQWPSEYFHIDDNIRRRDALLNLDMKPGAALASAIARGRAGWLAEMQASNLRGRGGAGFATAVKWSSARNAPGEPKVIVCNADEGEPGTFKDRVLLNTYADLVFEGMTLAAWAVGASEGFLYLRGEYSHLLPQLEAVLARRRAEGLLGMRILHEPGFDFDIRIHLGAGAYVCGEESALIESLEGKRGTPRIRPPFPVTCGYLGRPTVVNNVETLAKTCLIALQGGEALAATGTAQSAGTKLLSISGDCAAPGIYEYPFGVSIARVLEDCGASDTQAVQVGGASGICLAGYEFQRRIAYEDVPTAGAFMIFDGTRDLFEVARSFVHFFAHESCGFCTPCRVGTALLKGFMDKLADGHGAQADLADIDWLDRLLKNASHCGLGSAAPNPVIDTLQKFRPAYERRLVSLDFEPAFDLDAALAEARQLTARDDPGAHLHTHEEGTS